MAAAAAIACLGVLAHAGGTRAAGAAVPTPEELMRRVLTANENTPDIASADVLFKLRLRKPVTAPPDCEFQGAMRLERGRQVVEIRRRTAGLTCRIVNGLLTGRLFEGGAPMQTLLPLFDVEVLGEKLVGTDHFYLVQGRARDPRTNPRGLIVWIDYDRGLVTEGTLQYPWGNLDGEQRYTQVASAWVLTYQYLYIARFDASMEVFYSNFEFAPR